MTPLKPRRKGARSARAALCVRVCRGIPSKHLKAWGRVKRVVDDLTENENANATAHADLAAATRAFLIELDRSLGRDGQIPALRLPRHALDLQLAKYPLEER